MDSYNPYPATYFNDFCHLPRKIWRLLLSLAGTLKSAIIWSLSIWIPFLPKFQRIKQYKWKLAWNEESELRQDKLAIQ